MHPILYTSGDTTLHTYGLLAAFAFLLAGFVTFVRARKRGLSITHVADVLLVGGFVGLFGARAVFLFQNPEHDGSMATWLDLQSGGLVFYGAVLIGLPAALLTMRLRALPVWATCDVFATGLPLGHAVSRLGCLAAGCCHGMPTDAPWGITFVDPASVAPLGVPLHPTQIYESLCLFAIAAWTVWWYPKRRWEGQTMAHYLIAYGVARSLLEVFRGDTSRGYFLYDWMGEALTYSQGISVLVILVGVLVFHVLARQQSAASQGHHA